MRARVCGCVYVYLGDVMFLTGGDSLYLLPSFVDVLLYQSLSPLYLYYFILFSSLSLTLS